MTRYVQESLGAHETIVSEGRYPTVFWVVAWTILILLGPLVVGLIIFARWGVHMITTEFAVTDHRVILKRGWLNRSTQEITIDSVEGIELHQSLIGRVFNYGRLRIRGTGEALVALPNMAAPVAFRAAIENARERAGDVAVRPPPGAVDAAPA